MGKFVKTHGLSNHPIYRLWTRIKERCYSIRQTSVSARYYRNKGIKVCDEWKDNFLVFYDWCIKNNWFDGCSIDRINPNLDYDPNNCHLVSRSVNSKKVFKDNPMLNRGSNCKFSKLNEQLVLEIRKEWACGEKLLSLSKKYGVSLSVIYSIVSNKKWKHVSTIDATKRPYTRHSKLTEEMVRQIKSLLASGKGGDKIAKKFGVTKSIISGIKNGTRWSHVT